jgi:benzoyl-CoA reductase/2-hydroxyglutaryl-CoA dehydratase subunit BcrC/BadD/HgdB
MKKVSYLARIDGIVLSRNLCPLIKASYGHALQDSCPFYGKEIDIITDGGGFDCSLEKTTTRKMT